MKRGIRGVALLLSAVLTFSAAMTDSAMAFSGEETESTFPGEEIVEVADEEVASEGASSQELPEEEIFLDEVPSEVAPAEEIFMEDTETDTDV